MGFNFILVVIFFEINISINKSKVKPACELPKRRGRKNGKEESRIIKEGRFEEVKESWFLEIKT